MTARLGLAVVPLIALFTIAAPAQTPAPPPVSEVLDGRLPIGAAELPIFVSQDWSRPLPGIRRAVIVIHGYSRNAADYARNTMALNPPVDVLVVTPQFLAPEDIALHHLPDAVLRWDHDSWSGGSPAVGLSALSSFEALDAMLAKLADRAILPNLTNIAIAGFSAGGQVVQRYAIVGRGERAFGQTPIHLNYLVGSPSSYAYFTDDRPRADGSLGPFDGAAGCPVFDHWKYGFVGELPPYVAAAAAPGVALLERRYAARDIVYLVGSNDNDPNHRVLDKTCAGEAQGPNRLARMRFFFAALKQRDGAGLKQRMWVVDGAAHNEARVLGSSCGRAALFGDTACTDQEETK